MMQYIGLKIRQLSFFVVGLVMVLHLLVPHHHHYFFDQHCTHTESHAHAFCHQHHNTDASDGMACHSLNEMTVNKKKSFVKDANVLVKNLLKAFVSYKQVVVSLSLNKQLLFSDLPQALVDKFLERCLLFRGPPAFNNE